MQNGLKKGYSVVKQKFQGLNKGVVLVAFLTLIIPINLLTENYGHADLIFKLPRTYHFQDVVNNEFFIGSGNQGGIILRINDSTILVDIKVSSWEDYYYRISPGNRYVIFFEGSETYRNSSSYWVFDIERQEIIREYHGSNNSIYDIQFSNTGIFYQISFKYFPFTKVYYSSNSSLALITNSSYNYQSSYAPNDKYLLFRDSYSFLVYSCETWDIIKQIDLNQTIFAGPGHYIRLTWSPKSDYLVLSSYPATRWYVISIDDWTFIYDQMQHLPFLDFSPTGEFFVVMNKPTFSFGYLNYAGGFGYQIFRTVDWVPVVEDNSVYVIDYTFSGDGELIAILTHNQNNYLDIRYRSLVVYNTSLGSIKEIQPVDGFEREYANANSFSEGTIDFSSNNNIIKWFTTTRELLDYTSNSMTSKRYKQMLVLYNIETEKVLYKKEIEDYVHFDFSLEGNYAILKLLSSTHVQCIRTQNGELVREIALKERSVYRYLSVSSEMLILSFNDHVKVWKNLNQSDFVPRLLFKLTDLLKLPAITILILYGIFSLQNPPHQSRRSPQDFSPDDEVSANHNFELEPVEDLKGNPPQS